MKICCAISMVVASLLSSASALADNSSANGSAEGSYAVDFQNDFDGAHATLFVGATSGQPTGARFTAFGYAVKGSQWLTVPGCPAPLLFARWREGNATYRMRVFDPRSAIDAKAALEPLTEQLSQGDARPPSVVGKQIKFVYYEVVGASDGAFTEYRLASRQWTPPCAQK